MADPPRVPVISAAFPGSPPVIGHRPGTNVAPFEALFQITSLPGGYDDPKVIAYRLRSLEACVRG